MKERALSKIKVTLSYKLVRHALVTTKDGDFILVNIDRAEVEEKHILIRRNYNDFLLIHES